MTFYINQKSIGADSQPFIIAEMSGNHNQSLERALDIVDAAAESGAHAIKLQTYTAETMTMNVHGGSFEIKNKNSLWSGSNLYDLYKKAYTPWDWHKPIMDRAKEKGILAFSSPFDESAVDFLEELNVPAYKIASFENNHLPLIRKVALTKKPLILSTGMATLAELELAIDTAFGAGCKNIVLLKCTSTYPSKPINSNIFTIPHLRELFGCEVGLSDHTMGIGVAIASVALGAVVIEKHFTLSRADGGVDSEFSLEPKEMKSLVLESKRAWESLGKINYGPTRDEIDSLQFKRSIYVAKDIRIGEKFNSDNLRIIRPGDGAPPALYEKIIGCVSKRELKRGQPLRLQDLI